MIFKHIFLLLCFSLPSFAVTSIEGLRANQFSDGKLVFVDGNYQIRRGNDEMWQTGLSFRFQNNKVKKNHPGIRPLVKRAFVVAADYNLAKRTGDTFLNNGSSLIQFNRLISNNISWESFARHQFNTFMRLNARVLLGANLRFRLEDTETFSLIFGMGLMGEYENLSGSQINPNEDNENLYRRYNYYLAAKQGKQGDRTQFASTIFYQPRMDDTDDFRLTSENEMQLGITQSISFVLSIIFNYDSSPPVGVKRQDMISVNKIRVYF